MSKFNELLKTSPDEQNQKLNGLCAKFISDHNITCAETIYQVDSISLDSLEFIEEICEIVGYDYSNGEDDEE